MLVSIFCHSFSSFHKILCTRLCVNFFFNDSCMYRLPREQNITRYTFIRKGTNLRTARIEWTESVKSRKPRSFDKIRLKDSVFNIEYHKQIWIDYHEERLKSTGLRCVRKTNYHFKMIILIDFVRKNVNSRGYQYYFLWIGEDFPFDNNTIAPSKPVFIYSS